MLVRDSQDALATNATFDGVTVGDATRPVLTRWRRAGAWWFLWSGAGERWDVRCGERTLYFEGTTGVTVAGGGGDAGEERGDDVRQLQHVGGRRAGCSRLVPGTLSGYTSLSNYYSRDIAQQRNHPRQRGGPDPDDQPMLFPTAPAPPYRATGTATVSANSMSGGKAESSDWSPVAPLPPAARHSPTTPRA